MSADRNISHALEEHVRGFLEPLRDAAAPAPAPELAERQLAAMLELASTREHLEAGPVRTQARTWQPLRAWTRITASVGLSATACALAAVAVVGNPFDTDQPSPALTPRIELPANESTVDAPAASPSAARPAAPARQSTPRVRAPAQYRAQLPVPPTRGSSNSADRSERPDKPSVSTRPPTPSTRRPAPAPRPEGDPTSSRPAAGTPAAGTPAAHEPCQTEPVVTDDDANAAPAAEAPTAPDTDTDRPAPPTVACQGAA